MIIPVSLKKILPEVHEWLYGELMDDITLEYVRKYYKKEFTEGTVVSWNKPHDTLCPMVDIKFDTEEDALMFILRWS